MNRLRILFVLLALALLVPMALVVKRALGSVAAERAIEHRNVADRIADEMERELTAWLRREEDRPFAQYRFFYVPEESPSQVVNLVRSPLSELPREPFVVCYFQIDPDGTISSPLWPGNEELAAATGWRGSPEIRAMAGLVRDTIGDFWSSGAAVPVRDEAPSGAEARDPRGRDLADILLRKRAFFGVEEEAEEARTLLRSLDRGARERRERPSKVSPSQAANVYNFSRDDRDNEVQIAIQSQSRGALPVEGQDDERPGAELWTLTGEVAAAIEETLAAKASETIEVRLEPLVGRLATADHLVLYRAVSIGGKAYRQGLVLDVPELRAWLADRVLGGGELGAYAAIVAPGSSDLGGYSFRHRFAEPFGAVAAEIVLAPLPGSSGSVEIYALAVLLAAATVFGLFALYRMVAVRLAYAERRSNFVSAVTHELKTPLTAIRMYSEMLRDGVVGDEASRERYYGIMTAESERLGRLVQNVLELSQLEQQKRSVKLVAGDVAAVLEEVAGVVGPHAETQGFRLRLSVEPDLPPVRYDRDALVQVVFNLVDNALKYARSARDKEILLSCWRRRDGVALAVADRGPGVPRRHLKKIFEPFYRGEDELTRRSKGTGIGLALVRGLVEQMGGAVSGRNLSGGGFEVEVFLAA